MPVVLDGRETRCLTMRDGHTHRMKVSENGVLKKILGLKRDEVTCCLREMYSERLMVCTSHQILTGVIKLRIMRWVGHVARVGEGRSAFLGFGGQT